MGVGVMGIQINQDKINAQIEETRINGIKDAAQARIIAQLPEGEPSNFMIKQMNMLMLNAELDDIVINGGVLTPEQQAMKSSFVTIKNAIKDIRAMSNAAEMAGDSVDKFNADMDAKGY